MLGLASSSAASVVASTSSFVVTVEVVSDAFARH